MNITYETLWVDLEHIRADEPLIHNITNYVVMNSTANALLAVGASPIMAHALEEVADIARHTKALVINIGTLSSQWIDSMHVAMKAAADAGVPIVFDPVGVGATEYRTDTALSLLGCVKPSVIRGNAAEIKALTREQAEIKGVDSREDSESARAAAKILSREYNCVVCVSGRKDLVVSPHEAASICNGHQMMTRVTGLGCTASALVGAFVAVNPHHFQAAAHAMAIMGIAGEIAAEHCDGPASLQLRFIDLLYSLTQRDIKEHLKVEQY
jgi:hydroxyethylthiazole kinase